MFTLYKHEMKIHIKNLLIWTLGVGGMCFVCILLFSSVKEGMSDMAESFASMGAFSDAFGMSQLSIATLEGFYAAEVGTVHGLGGAMFAAMISTVILSKEEDGHTGEFLFTLPVARGGVITAKLGACITVILLFNGICVGIYALGFGILGESIELKKFLLFHLMQLLMQLEITAVCFGMSACMKKNKMGAGLGLVLLLYAYDLLVRVIPDMSDYKMFSPFCYANAADLFSTGEIAVSSLLFGMLVLLAGICTAYIVYSKRDLAV